ncbi:hypothetical protein Tco_1155423 [Tanacetum coccineum]
MSYSHLQSFDGNSKRGPEFSTVEREDLMSSASSAVTYTSVYTDSEPGRVFWGADEEIPDGGVPRVIVYGYDGLPMQPVDPPSPDYVPGPEHPLSPDYVPGPEHPPSPIEIPYVPEPEYPEYLEPFEDEEEEEHPAPADSSAIPVVDPVPSAGDTEAFETDESAPTPRPPQIRIPFAQTRLRRARKTVRPEPPMSASMDHALRGGAAGIRMRAAAASPPSLLPPTSPRTDVPEAEMPPRKRACLTTPAPGYEIGESSAAGAARQPRPTPEVDTWDEIVEAMMEIAPTTLEGLWLWIGGVLARNSMRCVRGRVTAIEAHVRTLEAQVATLITQTTSLQTRLTTALGHITTLEARDLEPQDGPAEAGSSC